MHATSVQRGNKYQRKLSPTCLNTHKLLHVYAEGLAVRTDLFFQEKKKSSQIIKTVYKSKWDIVFVYVLHVKVFLTNHTKINIFVFLYIIGHKAVYHFYLVASVLTLSSPSPGFASQRRVRAATGGTRAQLHSLKSQLHSLEHKCQK